MRYTLIEASEKNQYLSSCLEKISNGSEVKVVKSVYDRCEGRPSGILKVNYKLKKVDEQIRLTLKLYYKIKGDKSNRDKIYQILHDSMPHIIEFYAKNGIKLKIILEEKSSVLSFFYKKIYINVWDEHKDFTGAIYFPNQFNWSAMTFDDNEIAQTGSKACLISRVLGFFLGVVAILVNLRDSSSIDPFLAVSLRTVVYSIFAYYIFFLPFHSNKKNKNNNSHINNLKNFHF